MKEKNDIYLLLRESMFHEIINLFDVYVRDKGILLIFPEDINKIEMNAIHLKGYLNLFFRQGNLDLLLTHLLFDILIIVPQGILESAASILTLP